MKSRLPRRLAALGHRPPAPAVLPATPSTPLAAPPADQTPAVAPTPTAPLYAPQAQPLSHALVPAAPGVGPTIGLWRSNGVPVALAVTPGGLGAYVQAPAALAGHLPVCGPCRDRLMYNTTRLAVPPLGYGPDTSGWVGFTIHPLDTQPTGFTGPQDPPGWWGDAAMWPGPQLPSWACLLAAQVAAAAARPCAATRAGRRVLVRLEIRAGLGPLDGELPGDGLSLPPGDQGGAGMQAGAELLVDQPVLDLGSGEPPPVSHPVGRDAVVPSPPNYRTWVNAEAFGHLLGTHQVVGRVGGEAHPPT